MTGHEPEVSGYRNEEVQLRTRRKSVGVAAIEQTAHPVGNVETTDNEVEITPNRQQIDTPQANSPIETEKAHHEPHVPSRRERTLSMEMTDAIEASNREYLDAEIAAPNNVDPEALYRSDGESKGTSSNPLT